MTQTDDLEDWNWTVTFKTSHVDVADFEEQKIWAALWARMSHAHRYISRPDLTVERAEDGKSLTITSNWRSMQHPADQESDTLSQTPGCYLAWYKNLDQWVQEPTDKMEHLQKPLPPIDAPW